MDCSLPGSSVHGILQARVLECVSMPSFQGIFLIQGSNPHLLSLLHWQAGCLPLTPPWKSPCVCVCVCVFIYLWVKDQFNSWVGNIPWRRDRLPPPVFWPGEFHGLYSPWVTKSQTRLSDFHFHFWLHHHIPTRMTKFKTVTISTELNRV